MAVKQTIPTYTNSTKSLTLGNFKGIDASSSPFEVSASRATYCQNLIHEDGANHKRKGWTIDERLTGFVVEHGFNDLIDVKPVIFKVNGKNVKATVFAGFCRDENDLKVAVMFDDNTSYSSSEDYNSLGVWTTKKTFHCFENKGDIYFITCGNFYMITATEKEGGGYKALFGQIEYNSYKPTTTISINNEFEESKGSTRKSFEYANLVTSYRKNKLIGLNYENPIEFKAYYYQIKDSKLSKMTHLDIFKYSGGTKGETRFYPSAENEYTIYGQVEEPGEYYIIMWDGETRLSSNIVYIDHNTRGIYKDFSGDDGVGNYKFEIINGEVKWVSYKKNNVEYSKCSLGNKRYKLDTKIKIGTPVKITIKSRYQNLIGESYSCEYKSVDGYEWVGNYDYKYFKGENPSDIITEHFMTARVENETECVPFYLNGEVAAIYHNGYISFFVDTDPVIEGEDNIEIEYSAYSSEEANIIEKCTYGINYLGRILLSGNEDYPAVLYFSDSNDFTYFPYVNFNTIGSDSNEIVGFTVLNDSTIAVHKSDKIKEATIYYIKPSEVKLNELTNQVFSVKTGTMGETPVNNNVCHNLAGDNLIFSKNGVYGISLKSNISTDERYAYERSNLINTMLRKHKDLSNATAIVHNNRYYLAIDDVVYVADPRFKTSARDQDLNDTFNYEWWYWTNMPVKKWTVINDELAFVSKSGNIMKFYEGYQDKDIKVLYQGSLTKSSSSNTSLIYSPMMENFLSNNSEIELSIIQVKLTNIGDVKFTEKIEEDKFDVYFYNTKKVELFESGAMLHSCWQNGEEVYVVIESVDKIQGKIRIRNVSSDKVLNPTTASYFTMESRFDVKFHITNLNKYAQTFDLKLTEDGEPLEVLYLEMMLGALYSTYNVVSIWKTPILSLGTTTYSKNLLSSTLVCEPSTEGQIQYGCKTNDKVINNHSELQPVNGFDFENIDFTNLSFEEGLARSRTLKTKIRNFNFIEFIIKSDNSKDCSLNNLTITYNIGRKNKGVR